MESSPESLRAQRRRRTRRRRGDAAGAAYRVFKATRVFGSLDGLRAASIVAVIWFHTLAFPSDSLLGQGNHGVTLFFAISGFLIVTLILRAKQSAEGFRLGPFWGRRVLRILPLYYAVLLLYVGLVAAFERDAGARTTFWSNLPAFATFTSNWFVNLVDARVIFYFAWSLAAEEQFYLVWPMIERWLKGSVPLVLAGSALVVTQALALVFAPTVRDVTWLRIATSVPAAILLGVVMAHLLHRPQTFRLVWRVLGRRGSAIGALIIATLALGLGAGEAAGGTLAIAVALAALVGACVIREDNDLARVLAWRPLVWVGTVSYGMYLLHMIAVNLVRRGAAVLGWSSPWLDFAVGTLLALALATLSYLTYERFFLRLKARWFGATRPPPPASASFSPPISASGPSRASVKHATA